MSDILRMKTTQSSPDALRQLLHLSNKFYDLHTDRSKGYEDMDGLQYVGTMENFGSEMLFETRKLRMNRPPAKIVKPCATLSYYFNISHADFIESYPQQNMLMGCVKENVLLSNHTYQLKFSSTVSTRYVRSEAYSDQDAYLSYFRMTNINPTLIVDDVEYPLFTDSEDVTWYIAMNSTTSGKYTLDTGTGDLIINDLKEFIDLPALWLCVAEMRMLPTVDWFHGVDPGNLDRYNKPLVEFGTNGNDTILLYPFLYTSANLPSGPLLTNGFWYVKVYGDFEREEKTEYNLSAKITRIGYIHCSTESFTAEPDVEYYFTYNDRYVKLSLVEDEIEWTFRRSKEGDYDYNPTYNPVYACIPLKPFSDINTQSGRHAFVPLFKVAFSDVYFHPYESEINACDIGVHVDMSTDYSDNSISKRYGVIHNLAEFDGLPPYYKYYLDRTIHHAHVELYAIRDDANVRNQHAMDKQTAAIILDSSIPITDYQEITSDMKPVIIYDMDPDKRRLYITNPEHIVSEVNFLSDVGLIDKNHFGDVNIEGLGYTHKFIYHGNRRFSTGIIDVDPEVEYGRGYLITNDGIGYENNALSKNPKAPCTAARICDIPTMFTQLQNVSKISPTLVIDEKYVRVTASFSDNLYLQAWNHYTDWVTPTIYSGTSRTTLWITQLSMLNNSFSDIHYIHSAYGNVDVPTRYISFDECDQNIAQGGSGYQVDDQLGFNIGGIFFRMNVMGVDENGSVISISIKIDQSIPGQPDSISDVDIPLANFSSQTELFKLQTMSGTGEGAVLSIHIPDIIWNGRVTGIRTEDNENIFALVFEPSGRGVCFIPYNYTTYRWDENQMTQITGDLSIGNPVYDTITSTDKRSLLDVYLHNMLTNRNFESNMILDYVTKEKTISFVSKECEYEYQVVDYGTLTQFVNISKVISDQGLNQWNCFAAAVPSTDHAKYYTIAWLYDMNASFIDDQYKNKNNGNLWFPKFANMNLSSYDNSWSAIKFHISENGDLYPFMYDACHTTYDTYDLTKGDMCLVETTPITLQSVIPIRGVDYPEDTSYLYDGSRLNYNLYRFDHFKPFRDLDALKIRLTDMTSDQLLQYIRDTYGSNTDIEKIWYKENQYINGETYRKDDLIKFADIVVLPYESGVTYAKDLMIVDMETHDMYRSERPFVSTNLTTDIKNHNITYVGKKPTYQVASLYIADKTFVATTIQEDVKNENMRYIGSSTLYNDMVNYVLARTYQSSVYDANDIAIYEAGSTTLAPLDDNPVGGFIPLKDVVQQKVTTRGNTKSVEPLYVFRIDQPISDLDQFRMFDGDIDISPYTILLIKTHTGVYWKYMYRNNKWEHVYK